MTFRVLGGSRPREPSILDGTHPTEGVSFIWAAHLRGLSFNVDGRRVRLSHQRSRFTDNREKLLKNQVQPLALVTDHKRAWVDRSGMWPRPKPTEKQRRLRRDGVGVGAPTAFGEGVHRSDFYKPLDREVVGFRDQGCSAR